MKTVYVITAHRWGDRETHHYLVGVFSDLEQAKMVSDEHCRYRGGKYACVVEEIELDAKAMQDSEDVSGQMRDSVDAKEVYRANSIRN